MCYFLLWSVLLEWSILGNLYFSTPIITRCRHQCLSNTYFCLPIINHVLNKQLTEKVHPHNIAKMWKQITVFTFIWLPIIQNQSIHELYGVNKCVTFHWSEWHSRYKGSVRKIHYWWDVNYKNETIYWKDVFNYNRELGLHTTIVDIHLHVRCHALIASTFEKFLLKNCRWVYMDHWKYPNQHYILWNLQFLFKLGM